MKTIIVLIVLLGAGGMYAVHTSTLHAEVEMEIQAEKALKGSQVKPERVLSDEIGKKLINAAENLRETKKLDDMQAELITSALFLGAAIATEGAAI